VLDTGAFDHDARSRQVSPPRLVRPVRRAATCEITHSGASCLTVTNRITPVPRAVSTCPPRVLVARTNDLGALDLSARSGADRIDDAIADRQIWRGVASLVGTYGSVTAVPSRFGVVDRGSGRPNDAGTLGLGSKLGRGAAWTCEIIPRCLH
jgi:hypothetical protein